MWDHTNHLYGTSHVSNSAFLCFLKEKLWMEINFFFFLYESKASLLRRISKSRDVRGYAEIREREQQGPTHGAYPNNISVESILHMKIKHMTSG